MLLNWHGGVHQLSLQFQLLNAPIQVHSFLSPPHLQTSLALENVEVLMTSGAIQAYVPAADMRVVLLVSRARPKSVILSVLNSRSSLLPSISSRIRAEEEEKDDGVREEDGRLHFRLTQGEPVARTKWVQSQSGDWRLFDLRRGTQRAEKLYSALSPLIAISLPLNLNPMAKVQGPLGHGIQAQQQQDRDSPFQFRLVGSPCRRNSRQSPLWNLYPFFRGTGLPPT